MKKLLSLPTNLVNSFHRIEKRSCDEWFCASDPVGAKVGSGGGSAWLLSECWKGDNSSSGFGDWLGREKRMLIHAGGQSRRLPAYAPSGKILTPIPVFRWERGQELDQNLLDLQTPLYEKILNKAPEGVNTLIASGDVFIKATENLAQIPEADVVCYGLWVEPELAANHGVFVCDRNEPQKLKYMLQKPSQETIRELVVNNLFLMDVGIWLLSDRAVKVLMKKSGFSFKTVKEKWNPDFYDLYGGFGLALGEDAEVIDKEINDLTVAILPLQGGEFYHFGTSRELISSTLSIQNRVQDQRAIWTKNVKPHPAMFVQNAKIEIPLFNGHSELWIENSHISANWKISKQNIITGIPENKWNIELSEGICLDIVPIKDKGYCIRPYGFNDKFSGNMRAENSLWMGKQIREWFEERGINFAATGIDRYSDIQQAKVFPVFNEDDLDGDFIEWMFDGNGKLSDPKNLKFANRWLKAKRLSAEDISANANLGRLYKQRKEFMHENIPDLATNHKRSVFYQINLDKIAREYAENNLPAPSPLLDKDNPVTNMHDSMFRARIKQYQKRDFSVEEKEAFTILQQNIIEPVKNRKVSPHLNVYTDQIVWGRSPVRIDLAGGWTDTPPNCLINGGKVVNISIELNGQPPLQAYIKPCDEHKIILRSIDIGAREDITTYSELSEFNKVGSPFSIPKAALALSGFHPDFSVGKWNTLEDQLKEFGSGIEISLLAAIPKGSGLGTSSILAATVLGSLADFCGLEWDKTEICNRALVLEQLLTTGGGWQDQYGGILPGVKLLETNPGPNQTPLVRWSPDYLFTNPEYKELMLLYYTGITRTAKNILAEIVRGMFLNSTEHLRILKDMEQHALDTFDTIQQGSYSGLARSVAKTWEQKQQIDSGTNTQPIQDIISKIQDYSLGHKLPGAGGGGYMFIMAKDIEATVHIKRILSANPPNNRARFVDMNISQDGFKVSRS
jgi:galactokinase/mevalonate kinase-like predicted kinase